MYARAYLVDGFREKKAKKFADRCVFAPYIFIMCNELIMESPILRCSPEAVLYRPSTHKIWESAAVLFKCRSLDNLNLHRLFIRTRGSYHHNYTCACWCFLSRWTPWLIKCFSDTIVRLYHTIFVHGRLSQCRALYLYISEHSKLPPLSGRTEKRKRTHKNGWKKNACIFDFWVCVWVIIFSLTGSGLFCVCYLYFPYIL